MATLVTTPIYSPIYQIESTDDVQGGTGQIANAQAQSLGERDDFLKDLIQNIGFDSVDTTTMATSYPVVSSFTPVSGRLYVINANLGTYTIPAAASVADDFIFGVKGNNASLSSPLACYIKGTGAELIDDVASDYGSLNKHTVWAGETVVFKKMAGATRWIVIHRHQDVPAGTICYMTFGGGPNNEYPWLICNGGSFATADYPRLFAKIQYTYGGAGASFNVPTIASIAGSGGTQAYAVIHV